MTRALLAAAALAVAATPLAASAQQPPPFPYGCTVTWTSVAQWSPDTPVVGGQDVSVPTDVQCYG
ncbi:MAG TPA: hypothetical protein VFQ85_19495 [Mycobacteriales bacterium]|jgi:hypothetical protein|nr:hypothetical protein [Mycobacteriales bacterium]